ncbi:MAG TPA: hypothetical protein VJR89_15775, partial [Polyangiales bacterium]|nr:hypothetical protein [Polyangiales bacterium]
MTTKNLIRTFACSTLTLLPLVALGCGSEDHASGSTPQATAGGPAPTTSPSANTSDQKPADNAPATNGNTPSNTNTDTKPSDATPSKPSTGNQPSMQPPAAKPPAGDKPGTMDPAKPADDPGAAYPDVRGKCDINSGYPGDEFCITAPPAEEGLLIHVGPKDYKNEAEVKQYLLQPGDETSQCWTHKTPNDKDIWYQ